MNNINNNVFFGAVVNEQILAVEQGVVNYINTDNNVLPSRFLEQKQFFSRENLFVNSLQEELFRQLYTTISTNPVSQNTKTIPKKTPYLVKLSDRKVFLCEICGKKLAAKSVLKTHMRIHTDEKPYKCTNCEMAFRHIGNLYRHKRVHTDKRPYKCINCDKAFKDPRNLKRHKIQHTGKKPHKCTDSNMAFAHSQNSHRHTKMHTGEKPHKCTSCDKAFTQRGNLNIH